MYIIHDKYMSLDVSVHSESLMDIETPEGDEQDFQVGLQCPTLTCFVYLLDKRYMFVYILHLLGTFT